jgi:hypothetical protein
VEAVEVVEREEIITQAVWAVSLVCEASESGVGYFNRTHGFQVVLGILSSPSCPEHTFAAIGACFTCTRGRGGKQ